MTPERFRQIEELYHSAREREPGRRTAFLAGACKDDEDLRREVESLLAEDPSITCFLEEPVMRQAAGLVASQQSSSECRFAPGLELGPYIIEARLGAGGMGEVYRAKDKRLHRTVALKVLPQRLADTPGLRQRLEGEAKAISSLNHPHICTLYDIGRQGDIDYLVMEFLEGDTLAERIAGQPMALDDLLDLAVQIVDALEAAHAQGIVHRDIKPGNIMVSARGQAKVLDFGVAKVVLKWAGSASQAAGQTATETLLTTPGATVGTLAYMSPEQARGEESDARTDLFSFGAVLYEMATGQRAFAGKTPALVFAAILTEGPPQLPGVLGEVIARALKKSRDERWASAAQMKAALAELRRKPDPGATLPPPSLPARKRTLDRSIAVLFLMVAMAATALWFVRTRQAPHAAEAEAMVTPATMRRSVAVLGFKNLAGREDAAWLSAALSEMFVSELAAGEKLRTIPGENVARAKIDLSLPDADGYGRDTLERIRKTLGADYVVLGSYYYSGKDAGGQVRLDLRLQDSRAGETVATVSQTGTDVQLLDLVSRTGTQVRERLGVEGVTPVEATAMRAELPSSPEAYRLYAEGLARLRLYDALAARNLLVQAAEAEPANAMVHSAMAQAWTALGYDEEARQESRKAKDLSVGLSREMRLYIEGRYHQASREWDRAAETYGTLFGFFPDNLDYGLRLIAAQTAAGKGKDALGTAAALRKLPAPAREDPRIDIEQAAAAESLGDFHSMERLAAAAVQKGEEQGAGLLVARARLELGWALERLGQLPQAAAVVSQAKDTFARAGDNAGAASALDRLALVLYDQGDMTGARGLYQEVLGVYRKSGNRNGVAAALNNSANILYEQGNLGAAKKMYEQALSIQREAGTKDDVAGTLGNIANVLDGQGDLAGARKMQEEGLRNFRAVADKRGVSSTLSNLGALLREQGDLTGAKSYYEQALAMVTETGYRKGRGYALMGLGQIALARGDLGDARQKIEESLSLRVEMGDEFNAASSRVALANVAVEEGRLADASAGLRKAVEVFHKAKAGDDESEACAELARVLAAEGNRSEALAAVRRARVLQLAVSDFALRFVVMIAEARVPADSATAALKDTRERLQSALDEAIQHGYQGVAYEIRLALGELDMRAGKTAAARAGLAALEDEARGRGFGLIARKALAARQAPEGRK